MSTTPLLLQCVCGSTRAQESTHLGLDMMTCSVCGVMRQRVDYSLSEYWLWYKREYHAGVYTHSYEHDLNVARKRLDDYNLKKGSRVLDVGAGNGAFVAACWQRDLEAWGQEPGQQHDNFHIYTHALRECSFPTESFDVVTMHDVLEHIPNPSDVLQEIHRILTKDGELIIDFPDFWVAEGEHHWKPVEHLWMFTLGDLITLLGKCGYNVVHSYKPIPSKLVIRAKKVVTKKAVTILVPPGIGDGYWVLSKLRSFLQQEQITLPEIWVHDSPGKRRAGNLWINTPLVRFGGYAELGPFTRARRAAAQKVLDQAYKLPGHALQEDVFGFDYFMSFNGSMDAGMSLHRTLPNVGVNWWEPLFYSKISARAEDMYRKRYGKYIVVSFWDKGFYSKWLQEFSYDQIQETLQKLEKKGYTIVVIGSAWDAGRIGSKLTAQNRGFVDLIGKTSFDDLVSLIKGSGGVFGFPAGNTFLGVRFRKPTVLLWHNHFPRAMWYNSLPQVSNYHAMSTKVSPAHVASCFVL